MKTHGISPQEHQRIAEAIRQAEQKTSGEIYCVVAQSSDSYYFPAAFVVAVSTLAASLAIALLLEIWWFSLRLPVFVAAQILALAAALLLLRMLPGLRARMVPRRWHFSRSHENALKQFLARNVHRTTERTGVLIFVSLAERYAEIVADSGINARVGQDVWDKVVADLIDHASKDRLAEGFVRAIATVGDLLAAYFPVKPGDANELDDHLVEI